jgi:hypothetical protein
MPLPDGADVSHLRADFKLTKGWILHVKSKTSTRTRWLKLGECSKVFHSKKYNLDLGNPDADMSGIRMGHATALTVGDKTYVLESKQFVPKHSYSWCKGLKDYWGMKPVPSLQKKSGEWRLWLWRLGYFGEWREVWHVPTIYFYFFCFLL